MNVSEVPQQTMAEGNRVDSLLNAPITRRGVLKRAAATAGALVLPGFVRGNDALAKKVKPDVGQIERIPLVEGIDPSIISTSKAFKSARGHDVILKTEVQTFDEVQNRFDTAVLELFNVMYTNQDLFTSGALYDYLAQGNVPTGMDSEEFAQLVKDNRENGLYVRLKHYPKGAQTSGDAQEGEANIARSLRLNFVEKEGLFDINQNKMGQQIFGFTPKLTKEGGLQLDIYTRVEAPPSGTPNADVLEDIRHTWVASNMMQIMMMSYGVRDAFVGNAPGLRERLLSTSPFALNDVIGSNMSGKEPGSGNYFDREINYATLLRYQPISPDR